MDEERQRFWEDLLAYYRQELEERQKPAMVSMPGFFHGEDHAFEGKRLAEEGRVYLLKDGELRTKRLDELSPSDAPHPTAGLEANEARAGEHSTTEGDALVTEMPGGATLSHHEDASRHLRERWRGLKGAWEHP